MIPESDEDAEILNIYKTEDWIAEIITNRQGVVLDCQITIKPMTEFERRMNDRQRARKRYSANKKSQFDDPIEQFTVTYGDM